MFNPLLGLALEPLNITACDPHADTFSFPTLIPPSWLSPHPDFFYFPISKGLDGPCQPRHTNQRVPDLAGWTFLVLSATSSPLVGMEGGRRTLRNPCVEQGASGGDRESRGRSLSPLGVCFEKCAHKKAAAAKGACRGLWDRHASAFSVRVAAGQNCFLSG